VQVGEGSDAVLTCCICGRPTPTFEWSTAGRRVDSGRVSYDQQTGNLRLEVSRRLFGHRERVVAYAEVLGVNGLRLSLTNSLGNGL